jgi:hypothetical protein
MKRKSDSMAVEFPRPDPSEALEDWKRAHPTRPIGSGNKCARSEFPQLFHDICQWNKRSCISVYNSNRDYCGEIISSEAVDYYEISGPVVDEWEDAESKFDEKYMASLFCNGKFYKDRADCKDAEGREGAAELGCICEEFDEESEQSFDEQKEVVHKFVDKLLEAWQTPGWLNTWGGLYLVFHSDASGELLPTGYTVRTQVGSRMLTLDASRVRDERQCFIEFTKDDDAPLHKSVVREVTRYSDLLHSDSSEELLHAQGLRVKSAKRAHEQHMSCT